MTRASRTIRWGLPGLLAVGGALAALVATQLPSAASPPAPGSPAQSTDGPEQALLLPWGSCPACAGCSPARESASEGPMGFAVGPQAELYLLDQTRARIAVFAPTTAALLRQVPLPASTMQDREVASDGTIVVLDRLARRSPSGTAWLVLPCFLVAATRRRRSACPPARLLGLQPTGVGALLGAGLVLAIGACEPAGRPSAAPHPPAAASAAADTALAVADTPPAASAAATTAAGSAVSEAATSGSTGPDEPLPPASGNAPQTTPSALPASSATATETPVDPCRVADCQSGDGCCPFHCLHETDAECPAFDWLRGLSCQALIARHAQELVRAQSCKQDRDCDASTYGLRCSLSVVSSRTPAAQLVAAIEEALRVRHCGAFAPCVPAALCGGVERAACHAGRCIIDCNRRPVPPARLP